MSEPRLDLLRAYLLTLLAEGQFRSSSYSEMLQRALAQLAFDVPAVVGDVAARAAAYGVDKLAQSVVDGIRTIVATAAARGWKGIWEDVQEVYERGVRVQQWRQGK